ncbi:MAG: beta-galactosidase [Anaerolineae bacterium]
MNNYLTQQPVPFLAFELQYFRLPRERWELMLARLRQMGANAVSTSLCWGFHEPAGGQFDLTGATDPRRDGVGFVKLCRAMGLRVLLNVGPFIDAGTLGGGIPAWLLRRPEIHALRPDGSPWLHPPSGQPRCTFEHPLFLKHIRRWFEQVTEALAGQQWPDGPIVALQVDATPPWTEPVDVHFPADYNEHVARVQWPIWLRRHYDGVEELNAAYGAGYRTVSQVELPHRWRKPESVAELRRWLDARRFVAWSLAHALETYTGVLRELGWQVPLGHNLACPVGEAAGLAVDPGAMAAACDWLGQSARLPLGGNGPERPVSFEEYVSACLWRGKLARSYSLDPPPVKIAGRAACATPGDPAASRRDGPPLLISEMSAAPRFELQAPFLGGAGAVGLDHAVQVDPDPAPIGAGPQWAMEAALRPDGSPRRRAWHVRALFAYLAAGGVDYVAAQVPARVAVGYSHLSEQVVAWGGDLPGSIAGPVQNTLRAGTGPELARQLLQAGVDFDVVDVDRVSGEGLARYRWLLLPGTPVIGRDAWQKLKEFAAGGGRLRLVGEALPALDEHFQALEAGQATDEWLVSPTADWRTVLADVERRAWVDVPEVDVMVRYGAEAVYLAVVNRRTSSFKGDAHYLDSDGATRAVRLELSPRQMGLVSVRGGELAGAAWHAGGGGEVAAGATRFAFEGDEAAVASIDGGLVLSAPDRGRFRLTRPGEWGDVVAYRLLFGGEMVVLKTRVRGQTLSLDYVAGDERGLTESVWLLAGGAALPPLLAEHLQSLLAGQAQVVDRCADLCAWLGETLAAGPDASPAPDVDTVALADARRGLDEARAALRKATASLGALEMEVAGIRGEVRSESSLRPLLLDLAGLSEAARTRLLEIGAACANAAQMLRAATDGQARMSGDVPRTLEQYQEARSRLLDGVSQAGGELAPALARLRGDLAGEVLPLSAWAVHNWLEHSLRSLLTARLGMP